MSKSPRAGQLFLGLTFWVSRQVPGRNEFVKNLEHHGGTVLNNETDTSLNLINPEKTSSLSTACYDYKFILESIEQQQLLDESQYEIRGRHPANRITGSVSVAPKTTRTRFTAEDDQILYNWLEPFRKAHGKIGGNTIYEQLARVHPHHPYQSWRDRYLKFVMDKKNMTLTEVIDHDSALNEENVERPAKRRRVNANANLHQAQSSSDNVQESVLESVEVHPSRKLHRSISPKRSPRDRKEGLQQQQNLSGHSPGENADGHQDSDEVNDQSLFCTPERDIVPVLDDHRPFIDVETDGRALRRQELPQERFKQTSIGGQGFNYHEASRLYAAVLAICNTPSEELKSCWTNMAEHWNRHSATQWEMYYTHHILPEYKRANDINTQEELEAHVDDVMACEISSLPSAEESRQSNASEAEDMTDRPYQDQGEVPETLHDPKVVQAADKVQFQVDRITETDHPTSSDLASKTSAVQRVVVTANEGRKRATQQMDKNSTHSLPADPVFPSPSPKKKLFGNRLELAEIKSRASSLLVTQTEATGAQLNFTSSLAVQSTISSTGKTNATSSSTSIPTAHKPPQSFQLPPKSLSTSQESTNYETALQTQGLSTNLPKDITTLPEHPVDDGIDDAIDLLGDGETALEPDPIENALSDTGSEYMAFETGFERSQLWDADTRLDDERTEPSDDEVSQYEPKNTIRRATPLPRGSLSVSEHTESDEDDDEDSAGTIENGTTVYTVQRDGTRVETQALFQQPTQQEASVFDIPDPDGGWESFGVFDDPDEAIETVELPDDQSLKQRQSPSRSGINRSLGEPDNVQDSPLVAVPALEMMNVLSDAVEQPEKTTETPGVAQMHVKKEEGNSVLEQTYEARDSLLSPTKTGMRLSTASNAEQDLSILSTSRFGEAGTLPLWLTMQQEKYPDLPEMVLKRLASTASQAVNMSSLATATLLLQRLVDAFATREKQRQAEYRRRNPGTRKRLKPTFCLSSADAKALLPKDIPGVWTPEDDDKFYEKSHASIVHNENKHGVGGVKQRIQFLASRYDLELNNSSQKGPGKTAATSSRKRR